MSSTTNHDGKVKTTVFGGEAGLSVKTVEASKGTGGSFSGE